MPSPLQQLQVNAYQLWENAKAILGQLEAKREQLEQALLAVREEITQQEKAVAEAQSKAKIAISDLAAFVDGKKPRKASSGEKEAA